MKADELMVGDWVMHRDGPMKIESMWDLLDVKMKESDYKPIPVTPGILERNGFKYPFEWNGRLGWDFGSGYEYAFLFNHPSGGFALECCNKCEGQYDGVIHNVHELQHALRMCLVKKEIEL